MKDYSKEALVQYLIDSIPKYKEYWEKEVDGWELNERTFHLEMISLLHFTRNQIEQNETKHYKEEDIKKWKEENQTRPLPVEMTTLLEFVKIKLANNNNETVTKILDSVKETAEYAKDDAYFHELLEHWYKFSI